MLVRPNIMLLVNDDTSRSAVPKMPYLSAPFGADGKAIRFTNALHNLSRCAPSRVTMLTGRRATSTGVMSNDPQAWYQSGGANNTIYPWLRDCGYQVAHWGKYLNRWPWGNDADIPPGVTELRAMLDDDNQGTGHTNHKTAYFNYVLSHDGVANFYGTSDGFTTVGADASGRALGTGAEYSADNLGKIARNFIANRAKPPFFANLGFWTSHGAISVASRHAAHNVGAVVRGDNFNVVGASQPSFLRALPALTASEITAADNDLIAEWRSCQAVDEALRDIVTALKAAIDPRTGGSMFDTTIIIWTSDNGFHRGEHRLNAQKITPYEESIRTETIVRHPDRTTAVSSSALVGNIDIAASVLDWAGVKRHKYLEGRSMDPLVTGGMAATDYRKAYRIEYQNVAGDNTPSYYGIVTDTYKWIEFEALGAHPAEGALYKHDTNPTETVNLVNDPAYASIKADLIKQLATLKAA